jgi:predicted metal-dependent peptidase
MAITLPPHERVQAAKIRMLERQGFFGLVAARLEIRPDKTVNQTYTDGKSFTYNPDWVSKCSFDDLMFSVAKAAAHCALIHPLRRSGRDYRLWQQATTSATAEMLKAANFKLPEGVKIDFPGKSAEEIYAVLADRKAKQPPPGGGNGKGKDDAQGGKHSKPDDQQGQGKPQPQPGKPDAKGKPQPDGTGEQPNEVRDQPGDDGQELDQSQIAAAEQQALREIAAMTLQAKASGDGPPGDFDERLNGLLFPKMDWVNLVREYCQNMARNDYSYKRPNRYGWCLKPRQYLPSMISDDQLGTLVFAVDTSASLDTRKLQLAAGGLQQIISEMKFEKLIVLYCDSKVHATQEYAPGDDLEFKAVGRGNTNFRPVFNWIEEQGITPDLLIFFTDLEGRAPESEPDYPLIWLDQDGNEARAKRMMARYGIDYGRYVPMQC